MADLNGYLILFGMTAAGIYVFAAAYLQHKKIKFLHETAFALIAGLILGIIIFIFFYSYFAQIINSDNTIVFYILLPPMLFSSGYNLKKRRFFQNIFYINIFGFIGSIFNFLVIASLTYLINNLGWIRDWTNISNVRVLSVWEILLFSACLCSIDPIASLSQVKAQHTPKLFSIIFGESLLKDAFTIVLFKAILNLIVVNGNIYTLDFKWYTTFNILLEFLIIILASGVIGIIFAGIFTLTFKNFRFLIHDKGVSQVALIFICGYISYLLGETIGFSGVVSMLFCGIFLSHFNIYNMSEQGIQASKIAFKSISLVAEGLLFLVIGIQSWQVKGSDNTTQQIVVHESWTFFLLSLVIIFIARFVNIIVINYLFLLFKGKGKWRLNFYQLQIILMSGVIKGAVPFALTTSLPINNNPNINITTLILKSTVILIVIFTSLFVNAMIPWFIRNRLKVMKKQLKQNDPSLFDSLVQQQKLLESNDDKKYKSTTQKYWRKFDQGILKPFLIFNYAGRRQQIKQQKKIERKKQLGIQIVQKDQLIQNQLNVQNQELNKFVQIKKQNLQVSSSSGSDDDNDNDNDQNSKSKKDSKLDNKSMKQQQYKLINDSNSNEKNRSKSVYSIQINTLKSKQKSNQVLNNDKIDIRSDFQRNIKPNQ